jgi:5-methylthioadenosine/S-adenosylhomocysteine deaminase
MSAEALLPSASADLIIVNLNHPRAMPVHDITSALVLSMHSSDVETVIVSGQVLMRKRQILGLDEISLLAECRRAVRQLRQRAGIL